MLKLGGPSLLMLLLPLAGAAQITFSVDTVGFPPTTVDSTRTRTLTLSNDLMVEQTVSFSEVSAPFSLGIETVTIPGESSADVDVTFAPVSVSMFTLDLTATGNAFGSDVIHIIGEGTLPQASLLADTLDFGSVSVNSYATEYLPMASVGIGSLYVDSIVSSNPVISAAQGVAIAQGDTAQIPITFYSEFSGIYEVDLTIYTSDPFESIRYAHCTISAISEVGGEVCGTWSLVNSPYLLVDDVVVPNGCTLTIEPGVVILGDSHDIEVFGALYANGTAELPIDMTVGELLSHTAAENMVLTYSTITETNECLFSDTDILEVRDYNPYSDDSLHIWLDEKTTLYPFDLAWYQDNSFFHLEDSLDLETGYLHQYLADFLDEIETNYNLNESNPILGNNGLVYVEDFEDDQAQSWSYSWSNYSGTGSYNSSNWENLTNSPIEIYDDYVDLNSTLLIGRQCCTNSDYTRVTIESPQFDLMGFEENIEWKFNSRTSWWSDTRYLNTYVTFDDNSWDIVGSVTNPSSNWEQNAYQIAIPSGSTTVKFRTEYRFRYYGELEFDDCQLSVTSSGSNFWPSELMAQNEFGLENLDSIGALNVVEILDYLFESPSSGTTTIDFVKSNYANSNEALWDSISPNVSLWRDSNQGLYNPVSQSGWSNHIEGTLWGPLNSQDLNLYTSSWQDQICTLFGNCDIGNTIVGQAMSLYVPEIDEYFIVEFDSWSCCGQGGFAYRRTKVGDLIGNQSQIGPQPFSSFGDYKKYETLSTGGITLENSFFRGDFHSVANDSLEVVMNESILSLSSERDKVSHGLGLYAPHVSATSVGTFLQGHGMDGWHVEADNSVLNSSSTQILDNGEDGLEWFGTLIWQSDFDQIDSNEGFGALIGTDLQMHSNDLSVTENGLSGISIGNNCLIESHNILISSNGNHGIECGGDMTWLSLYDLNENNSLAGLTASGALTFDADSTFVTGNGSHGIEAMGSNSDVTLYQCQLKENGGDGIRLTGSLSDLEADYSFVRDNGGDAVEMGSSGTLRMDNCLLGYNGGYGINSSGAVDLNYMNILHNGGYGIRTSQFSTVDNSIVWFNGGVPQMITGNTFAVSYTNVQGINALLTSTDFAWGDGCIGTDPVLADDQGHLDPYSPCVDGGMPWEQDAHIPYGLGSSRADMGMYGGPANDYWGGQAPPDGAVQITDVFDIPQDQGGFVGMHFTASPFDFGGLGFNVTHYSIWRDLALGSDTPADVSAGNWEQIGEVPAQGFSQYGYTAATLVDAYPDEPACLTSFIVIAHTTDDNIYWVSDVAAACSEDNLAPAIPELGGMVLADETDEAIALLSWTLPEEEDYAYTVVTGDNGFNGTVTNGDTLVTDPSLEPGLIVTYEAVHFDVHGNASETAALALEATQERDQIPLNPGWNLISTDRSEIPELSEVFSGLIPGNLQYVTGFDNGIAFYDPNGFPFLNSLTSLTPGMGYWVKVEEADVLEVNGARLDEGYMPALAEGWNLIGYAPEAPEAPGVVFADLVATGDLLYVTGFDLGVQVYDPLGLPFLNSLGAMRNGFGYWVKSAAATEAGVFSPLAENALLAEQPSPLYDVVNGVSELGAHAGEFVDVVNDWGMTVGRLPILEGGHLMTTALFGDDPATSLTEGLSAGETLHFAFRGAMANETLVFGGDMAHKTLSLTFEEVEASMSVFPNPASDAATLRFQMDKDAQVEVTLMDLAGRQVAVLLHADKGAGAHAETLDLPEVEAGAYTVQMRVAGEVAGMQRLVITQ